MRGFQEISQSMKGVSGSSSMDDFARVSSELVQLKNKVREELQAATVADVTKILKKLAHGELLTSEERNLVELWIVGDAEGYTKMENNFGQWQEEFHRLGDVFDSYAGESSSPQTLVEVHGLLEDAIRLAADISYFLEKKDRVERFRSSIDNLTPEDARFLGDMLKSMMSSVEM